MGSGAAGLTHVVGYYIDHQVHATRVLSRDERREVRGGTEFGLHRAEAALVVAVVGFYDLGCYRGNLCLRSNDQDVGKGLIYGSRPPAYGTNDRTLPP